MARRFNLVSRMGRAHLLADLLAFGALPAALAVRQAHPAPGAAAVAVAYARALGAVWRLARYDEEEAPPGLWGPCFKGVPSPVGGAAVVAAVAVGALVPSLAWLDLVAAAGRGALLMPSTRATQVRGIGAWPWMVTTPLAVLAAWWAALRRAR